VGSAQHTWRRSLRNAGECICPRCLCEMVKGVGYIQEYVLSESEGA
jgi:hypothetical protein